MNAETVCVCKSVYCKKTTGNKANISLSPSELCPEVLINKNEDLQTIQKTWA